MRQLSTPKLEDLKPLAEPQLIGQRKYSRVFARTRVETCQKAVKYTVLVIANAGRDRRILTKEMFQQLSNQ